MVTAESGALDERRIAILIARGVSYVVYAWLVAVEIILLLGFILLLFGANPSAGFTQWVYRNLERVMEPFRGIFAPIQVGTTSTDIPAIFDTSVLFAMIVYGIVALAMSALIGWLSSKLSAIRRAQDQAERNAVAEQQLAEAEDRRRAIQAAQEAAHPAPAPAMASVATTPHLSAEPVAPTPPTLL